MKLDRSFFGRRLQPMQLTPVALFRPLFLPFSHCVFGHLGFFFADCTSFTSEAFVAVDRVFSSFTPPCLSFFKSPACCILCRLICCLVAAKANIAGTQWISIVDPLYLRRSIAHPICCTMCCPNLVFGNPTP